MTNSSFDQALVSPKQHRRHQIFTKPDISQRKTFFFFDRLEGGVREMKKQLIHFRQKVNLLAQNDFNWFMSIVNELYFHNIHLIREIHCTNLLLGVYPTLISVSSATDSQVHFRHMFQLCQLYQTACITVPQVDFIAIRTSPKSN